MYTDFMFQRTFTYVPHSNVCISGILIIFSSLPLTFVFVHRCKDVRLRIYVFKIRVNYTFSCIVKQMLI